MYGLGRSNAASALTRKVRRSLGERAETLKTHSHDLTAAPCCELTADELEVAMSARQFLQATGFECTDISRFSWGFTFYVTARNAK
jgi:hypothetical protein